MANNTLLRTRKLMILYMHWLYTLRLAQWFLHILFIITRARNQRLTGRRYVLDFVKNRKNMIRRVYDSDTSCIDLLRMDRRAFTSLCGKLAANGVCPTNHLLVDEQVAIFLEILAHHTKNRVIRKNYLRSSETISRYFNIVLNAVIRLQGELLKKPEPIKEDCTDPRWRFFKNCLGALDGTHIPVKVSLGDRPRYRNRKGEITTNVLGVCSQDMQFIYVLPGWEGSAADSRVLRDAIDRRNGLKVPRGCYYLVDAGYTNCEGFLAPYRGQRYHLSEWREGHQPRNPKEYLNMKHASARNVIERCFGVLKIRWSILRSPSFYPIKTQNRIIMACCLLQNYIRQEMLNDPLEHVNLDDEDDESINIIETSNQWTNWRDNLAHGMYNEWRANTTR